MSRRGNDFKFLSDFRFYRYGAPLFGCVAEQSHHGFICLLARNFIIRKNLVPDFDFLDRFQAFFRLYKRALLETLEALYYIVCSYDHRCKRETCYNCVDEIFAYAVSNLKNGLLILIQ